MAVRSYRDLIVWQKGMDLTVEVYKLARQFPSSERYRLVDQLTRAAASVAANIAEGHERTTRRDYANFVSMARGSLAETETFLILAQRLEYATAEQVRSAIDLASEVGRMLSALRGSLMRDSPSP